MSGEESAKTAAEVNGSPAIAAPTTTTTCGGMRQAANNNSSEAWDTASLETFLSTTMPRGYDAKDAAEKLLDNGYTTKQQLLGARKDSLQQAGLNLAQIDQILGWQEERKSASEPAAAIANSMFSALTTTARTVWLRPHPPQRPHLLTVKRDRTTWDIGALLRPKWQGLRDKIMNWTIEPSVWQALGPSLLNLEFPELMAFDKVAGEQGTKRKVFVLDTDDETANQDRKKRRLWKASLKPAIVEAPAPGTWYQGVTMESELFIRDCTTDCFQIMWKFVEKEKQKSREGKGNGRCIAFIVTGPPGLGKSWSSNMIVWKLLKNGQNIWFHSASDRTLTTFTFEGDDGKLTISEKPEEDVYGDDPPKWTWFLYDSVGGSADTSRMVSFQKKGACVPCVIFSSPKDTNYKQGIKEMETKGAVWHLWMPPWEWHEMEAVMHSLHKAYGEPAGMELGEFSEFVRALYDVWGGIPCTIVSYCQKLQDLPKEEILQDSQGGFKKQLSNISKEIISRGPWVIHSTLDNAWERGEAESRSRKTAPPSWLLFPVPVDSEKRPFQKYTYRFCSQQAEYGFLDRLEAANADAVRTFCREVFQVRGTSGIAFERFAHFVLTRTQSNIFRWKQYVSTTREERGSVVLPKCLNQKCEMDDNLGSFVSAIEECIRKNRFVVIDPVGDQQDAIDMFVVCKLDGRGWCVLAIQDTISKTHSFYPVKILEYRQAAEKAFKTAMPGQNVSDDFFLHVIVVPEENAYSEPFHLQGAAMTDLAEFDHVLAKFKEIGLEVPSELDDNWNVMKARDVCQAAKLKDHPELNANELVMAGARILLLNEAGDKVKGLTWVLDGILNQ